MPNQSLQPIAARWAAPAELFVMRNKKKGGVVRTLCEYIHGMTKLY